MAVWSRTSLSRIVNYDRIDGEYFLPEYLDNDTTLSKFPTFSLPERFCISDGNHMSVSKHFSEDGDVPYYRGQDVNDFFLENATPVKIPYSVYDSALMQRSHFKEGDVLLSIVGTIGSLSVVSNKIGSATGSCKIAILRGKGGFSPYALAAFLATKYGQLQIKRNTRGAIQMGLILRDLVRIRVPDFDGHQAKEIASLIQKAIKKNRESRESYAAAERMLAEALKLDDLKLERPLSYTAKFSDVLREGRTDAEYYHGKYEPMLAQIRKYSGGVVKLSELTQKIDANFNPIAVNGDVNYTEIGDVNISNGRYISNVVHGKDLPTNAKIRLEGGELLISTVRPTRGAITIIKDKLPLGVNLCSGAFYVCTVQDKKQREILWLYLREVKDLFEKYCGGSSYPTIDARYIQDFPVPRFDDTLACEVRKLVLKSKQEASKSDAFLAEAKATVERLIEAAADRP